MDNGTMVETFKYLSYCQLAKSSLVSKRFCHLIQTHRHKLPLLYVDNIGMYSIPSKPVAMQIFDKELSSESYNEWVVCNNYSEQAPLEGQDAATQSTKSIPNGYQLFADAHYEDPNHREFQDRTTVFSAQVELNHENWPLFQHFIRLVTDPFIYIDGMELTYQSDVLNLLSEAINSGHERLRCKELTFNLNGNTQKSITWTKNHVRCNEFHIYGAGDSDQADLNKDDALLDFFVAGAHCTSLIFVIDYDLSKAMLDFVKVTKASTKRIRDLMHEIHFGELAKNLNEQFEIQEGDDENAKAQKKESFHNHKLTNLKPENNKPGTQIPGVKK